MEGRRRTIELDEEVADALEKRAAAVSTSVNDMLAAQYLGSRHVEIPPEDLAELETLWADWERDPVGYDADEMLDWLRARVEGRETPHPPLRRY